MLDSHYFKGYVWSSSIYYSNSDSGVYSPLTSPIVGYLENLWKKRWLRFVKGPNTSLSVLFYFSKDSSSLKVDISSTVGLSTLPLILSFTCSLVSDSFLGNKCRSLIQSNQIKLDVGIKVSPFSTTLLWCLFRFHQWKIEDLVFFSNILHLHQKMEFSEIPGKKFKLFLGASTLLCFVLVHANWPLFIVSLFGRIVLPSALEKNILRFPIK